MSTISPRSAPHHLRVRLPSLALVTVTSVLVAWLARWGPDWPAQEFRAWIAGHDGLSLWTMRWYSGSALPGYSVLYPPLAAVLGAGTVGVVACVAITWSASGAIPNVSRRRATLIGVGIAVSVTENLLIGQVPFLLGTAFAVAAVRSLLTGRSPYLTAALAALASLSSPLAGAFVLLVSPALAHNRGVRAVLPLGAAITGSAVAFVIGGVDGPFPCPWQTFLGVAAFCVAILVIAPRSQAAMRLFAACYLLVDVAAFLAPNPIGGNVARLAKLVAIPLAVYYLDGRGVWSRIRTSAIAVLAVVWPTVAFASSVVHGADDPSRAPSFYAGIDRFLASRPALISGRLEIPFTREHWESYFVARHFPIARGWERQSDLQYNAVLYNRLTPARYRAWLDDNAVSVVALPRAPLDTGGKAEAALLRHAPSYLVPVWQDAHWRVWRVADPEPLVSGPARLVDQEPSALTLHFSAPGTAVVRVRASNLWVSDDPDACIGRTPRDWLTVSSPSAGNIQVKTSLTAQLITGTGCPGDR